ncbi:AraC family transcriptional regulator [Lutibacter sp.]
MDEIKELKIKGMVCPRCISTVRQELENLGVKIVDIELGRVIINCAKNKIKIQDIELVLKRSGFELLTTHETKTIEAIKLILIGIIDNTPIVLKVNLSEKLETSLNRDYTYLSKLFSKVSGITIEKYFIQLKIEKSKEFIQYNQLNFTEISYELGYSSVNYLSNQFKQITGMSMSDYKNLSNWGRTPLNKIL